MRSCLSVLTSTVLVFGLSVAAYPSINTHSYLFKNSVLKSQQSEHNPFLLSQQSQDSTAVNKTSTLKLKSPYWAIFYSIVPGLLIHGSGHFYAGWKKTAYLLFGAEVGGAAFMFVGGLSGMGIGPPSTLGSTILFIGTCSFVGSWVYDIIGSPLAVQKKNKELLQKKNSELKFEPNQSGLRIVLVYHF